jgi:hypothetical protein
MISRAPFRSVGDCHAWMFYSQVDDDIFQGLGLDLGLRHWR